MCWFVSPFACEVAFKFLNTYSRWIGIPTAMPFVLHSVELCQYHWHLLLFSSTKAAVAVICFPFHFLSFEHWRDQENSSKPIYENFFAPFSVNRLKKRWKKRRQKNLNRCPMRRQQARAIFRITFPFIFVRIQNTNAWHGQRWQPAPKQKKNAAVKYRRRKAD